MEKAISQVREVIAGSNPLEGVSISELRKCAVDIATAAFVAYRDELRDLALDVAKAVAAFDDELEEMTRAAQGQ